MCSSTKRNESKELAGTVSSPLATKSPMTYFSPCWVGQHKESERYLNNDVLFLSHISSQSWSCVEFSNQKVWGQKRLQLFRRSLLGVVYTCETFSTLSCFMFFRSFLAASERITSLIFRQFSNCWMSRVIKHTTQLVWWAHFFTLFKLSVLHHFWNFFQIFFSH